MRIELIRFYSFGPVNNSAIALGDSQLNILAEKSASLKELILCSIWATLYGFVPGTASPGLADYRNKYTPQSAEYPYRVSMDLSLADPDRKIRIVRDFTKNAMQVLDRESKTNITSEFKDREGNDIAGRILLDMPQDLFFAYLIEDKPTSIFDLILKELAKNLANSSDGRTAGNSKPTTIVEQALGALSSSSVYRLDQWIKSLEVKRSELESSLHYMDEQRSRAKAILKELRTIDNALFGGGKGSKAREFETLQIEFGELEKQHEFASRRIEDKIRLEERIKELEFIAPSNLNLVGRISNLWTRRTSRQDDQERMLIELEPLKVECQRLDDQLKDRYDRARKFTKDEAKSISALAISLYKLQQDIDDLQRDLQEETGKHLLRIKESSDRRGNALHSLQKLHKTEFDDAKNYASLIALYQARMSEEKKKLQNAKLAAEDIEVSRNQKRKGNLIKAASCGLLSLAFIAAAVAVRLADGADLIFAFSSLFTVIAIVCTLLFGYRWMNYKYHLKNESLEAERNIKRHEVAWSEAETRVEKLNAKVAAIANQTGISRMEDFLHHVREASSHESIMLEQASREQTVETEEQKYDKVKRDLSYYFEKAGMEADPESIDSNTAMELSKEINQYHADSESQSSQFENFRNASKQLEFIEKEIADIDAEIESSLAQLGLSAKEGQSLENRIEEMLTADKEKTSLNEELNKIAYDLSGYGNIDVALSQMKSRKLEIKSKIEELLKLDPSLAHLHPDSEESAKGGKTLEWGVEGAEAEEEIARLEEQKNELLRQFGETVDNFDEHYLESREELEITLQKLHSANKERASIKLAEIALQTMAAARGPSIDVKSQSAYFSEFEKQWSTIAPTTAGLIHTLGLDSQSRLSASFSSGSSSKDLFADWSNLSPAERDITRFALAAIYALITKGRNIAPIFLKEPEENTSEEVFSILTDLILSVCQPHQQIIIPSCRYKRYQEIKPRLEKKFQNNLVFRARKKLSTSSKPEEKQKREALKKPAG